LQKTQGWGSLKLGCAQDRGEGGPAPWITFAIYDGIVYGDNYGYLSCTIPEKGDGDALMRGTTAGKLLEKLRK